MESRRCKCYKVQNKYAILYCFALYNYSKCMEKKFPTTTYLFEKTDKVSFLYTFAHSICRLVASKMRKKNSVLGMSDKLFKKEDETHTVMSITIITQVN